MKGAAYQALEDQIAALAQRLARLEEAVEIWQGTGSTLVTRVLTMPAPRVVMDFTALNQQPQEASTQGGGDELVDTESRFPWMKRVSYGRGGV